MSSTHIILSPSLPALSLSLAQITSLALEREVVISFSLVGISNFTIRNGGRKKRNSIEEERREREGERKKEERKGLRWLKMKRKTHRTPVETFSPLTLKPKRDSSPKEIH